MLSREDEVYRKLQQHLDKMPIGFPATESGVEIRILKQLFTPQEARIALALSVLMESPEKIHARLGSKEGTVQEVAEALDHARHTVLVTLEVDDPVALLVTTALVPNRDAAVVVAATTLRLLVQQCSMGLALVQFWRLDRDVESASCRRRF